MLKFRKLASVLLALFLCLNMGIYSKAADVSITSITGNDSLSNAYNYGRWNNAKSDTTIIEPGQNEAYFKFTINTDERIYISCSYRNEYEGMSVELLDSLGNRMEEATSPSNVINPDSIIPFLAVNCNGRRSSEEFYIKVNRGNYDNTKSMYFTISFANRIRNGQGTFNFSGTASNPGNVGMSLEGVNSSILKLNLGTNTAIPNGAIVTRVTTAGTQSPSQGNVHHMIMPSNENNWFTSIVSNASSGSYNISITEELIAHQEWQFRYNAKAGAKSTMKNVKLTLYWEYDLADNNYEIFIK